MEYLLIQVLNGVQLGLLMFLLAAGLTLTFGIMDLVNLAYGSLYMMGAYVAWTFITWTDSFVLGALLALPATFALGVVVEAVVMRRLYARFDTALTAEAEAAMQAMLDANPQGKHGKHSYDLADYGLDRAGVHAHFRDYTARFGIACKA